MGLHIILVPKVLQTLSLPCLIKSFGYFYYILIDWYKRAVSKYLHQYFLSMEMTILFIMIVAFLTTLSYPL